MIIEPTYIKTPLTDLAFEIAKKAHAGQKDRGKKPYIEHPVHVAEQLQSEEEVVVALLHDVLEDSQWTREDLLNAGIPEHLVDEVVVLTRLDGEDYDDYIERVKGHKIATAVKIKDLEHNSDLGRLKNIRAVDIERRGKYQKAILSLKGKG